MKSYARSHLADDTLLRNVVPRPPPPATPLLTSSRTSAVLTPLPATRPSLEVVATTTPQRAELALEQVDASSIPGSDVPATPAVPARVAAAPRPRVTPLASGRFGLQVTIDQETHDLLRYAQALLSHVMPPSDLAAVLKRMVKEGIVPLERQRFAATTPYARGGKATASNIRLCCRAHNRYEAERMYGAEFMRRNRETRRTRSAAGLPIALGQP